jgi:valyl-tRNA synthetase
LDASIAMSELSKTYDPTAVEPKWYRHWIDKNHFHADEHSSKPAFCIVMPPPNITGMLTLGHVLNDTIQDILTRRARMLGHEALWLPGMDHAGVATQTAVEKHLRKTEKKTRHDLGREEFLRRVVDWQEKHGGIIIDQLKRLGCSCDWSRQRYTLDPEYVRAVLSVFVDLYKKGLIYRGRRMINWDPAAQTALSDEEVINKPQKGNLYYVRYEIVDEPGKFLEVATTRPETIMADTGLAVHPGDKRYVDLIGKQAWRPLAREKIPIVSDEAIDPKFGTGVLKVTPAHDKIDFDIGQRHELPVIDVLTPQGRIDCPAVPELHGLDRFEARQKAADLLQDRQLLSKTEPHENSVGFSERSEVPIEPRLSEQWFLRYPKTKEALAVVREHLIRFFPVHWEKVYAQWLENIQDWCISRQVWWGHRIPAWYANQRAEDGGQKSEIYVGIDPPADPENWTQDPDTLDTWFSSWLWAYETMDVETRKKFYPTSVLVTAPDIIFFWVARMIIAGLEFKPGTSDRTEDNIPFRNVFLTGLIRDGQGRKMSKSLGNSPDPLDLIAKYGADGLRFGLMRIAPSGQDIRFDEKQIEEGRNFATKLWNAARFRQVQGPSNPEVVVEELTEMSPFANDIVVKLDAVISKTEEAYKAYAFSQVAQLLYDFVWSDFCDRFLEAAKTYILGDNSKAKETHLAVIDYVLSAVLRLLHPFMPHITEELWQTMGFQVDREDKILDFTLMPEPSELGFTEAVTGTTVAGVVYEAAEVYDASAIARNLRAEFRIASNKKVDFVLRPSDQSFQVRQNVLAVLKRLINARSVKVDPQYRSETGTPVAITPLGDLYLLLDDAVDANTERERLDKEIEKLEVELRTVRAKLDNASFVERAPATVVAEHRQREKNFSAQLEKLKKSRGG